MKTQGFSAYENIAISVINPRGVSKTEVKTYEDVILERPVPGYNSCSLVAVRSFNRVDVTVKIPEPSPYDAHGASSRKVVVARLGPLNEGVPSLVIEDSHPCGRMDLETPDAEEMAQIFCAMVLGVCRPFEGPTHSELKSDRFWKTFLVDLFEMTEVHLIHTE